MARRANNFSAWCGSNTGGEDRQRSGQFDYKGITGWLAALLAVGTWQQFADRHQGRTLTGLIVGVISAWRPYVRLINMISQPG